MKNIQRFGIRHLDIGHSGNNSLQHPWVPAVTSMPQINGRQDGTLMFSRVLVGAAVAAGHGQRRAGHLSAFLHKAAVENAPFTL